MKRNTERTLFVLLLLLLSPLLFACGAAYDYSGTVASKEYNEGHMTWVEGTTKPDCGYKYNWYEGDYQFVCTAVYVPGHEAYVAPEYVIVVYVDNERIKGEYRRVHVSQSAWGECRTGSWFTYEAKACIVR